jgi:hypothetical protein
LSTVSYQGLFGSFFITSTAEGERVRADEHINDYFWVRIVRGVTVAGSVLLCF